MIIPLPPADCASNSYSCSWSNYNCRARVQANTCGHLACWAIS